MQVEQHFPVLTHSHGGADPLALDGDKAGSSSSKTYRAPAYNAPDVERGMLTKQKQPVGEEPREFVRYRRQTKLNLLGTIAFITYILALGFYIWVRITKTLDLGPYLWYVCNSSTQKSNLQLATTWSIA